MADSVKKWYVVRAIGGQENKVQAYIETEIARLGLSDYVDQVLVPKEKVIQIRDGKKIHKEKVYFPGYIMVEANLAGEVPHVIKSVTGVIGFLGEGNESKDKLYCYNSNCACCWLNSMVDLEPPRIRGDT